MVNKAALSVLGVIVLVSMGVGILIGMQLGGPAGSQATDGGGGDGGSGPTPIPSEGTGTPTPVPTAEPTSSAPTPQGQTGTQTGDSPNEQETPSPYRFDSDVIRAKMEQFINERRDERGHPPLDTTGLLAERVRWMAQNHSADMAEEGRAIHRIDGRSSAGRYRQRNLYDSCKFQPNDGGDTINADGDKFENIAKVYAGKYYSKGGESRIHKNNTAVAKAIVDDWFDNRFLDDRLLYDNANVVGVGVTVTDSGEVYATTNVC